MAKSNESVLNVLWSQAENEINPNIPGSSVGR